MRASPCTQVITLALILLLLSPPWLAQAAGTTWTTRAPTLPQRMQALPLLGFPQPNRPEQRLLELINETRWEHGYLPPLKANVALARAAQAHSESMAQNDFFDHKGKDQSSPWDRIDAAGYGNWYVLAENLVAGSTIPEEVLRVWMESPRHRDNILNAELREAGVGHAYQPGDTYPGTTWGYEHYWTLNMGSRWDAYPLVLAGEAYSTTTRTVPLYFYGEDWASEMRLSNDGVTWSDWQSYRPFLYWELTPGDGLKWVYGQLRDAQGNTMSADDWIILERKTVPPGEEPLVNVTEAVFAIESGASVGQPQRYRLQIQDPHGGISLWRASWDGSWLHLSASSGMAPAQIVLSLTDQARLLPPGVYSTTLSIQASRDQVQVPVRLYVFSTLYSIYLPNILRFPSLLP